MERSRRVAAVTAFLAIVLAFQTDVRAQAVPRNDLPPDWHFRFDLFQMLLEQHGLQPVQTVEDVFAAPGDSVVVIVGQLPDDRFWSEARTFLNAGGRVLVASDRDGVARRWFRFNAGPVITNRRAYQYQQHNDCLQIVDLDQSHPVMAGVNTVVVNRSGWLSGLSSAQGDWKVVAALPPLMFPSESSGSPLIAVAKPNEAGRIVLAADHSLFTNGMLWHGDNATLAVNISEFLCEGGRKKILFVADGQLQGSYASRLPPLPEVPPIANPAEQLPQNMPEELPELPLDQVVRLANLVVTRVEDSNLLNSAVMERPRNIPKAYFRRGLLTAAALLALILIVRALTNNNPAPAAVTQPRSMLSPTELSIGQRDTPGGRGAAAKLLVSDLCRRLALSGDPEEWKRQVTEQSLLSKSGKAPKSVRETVPLLLSLAFNRRTPHLSRSQFLDVGRAVEHLRQATGETKTSV